MALTKDVTPMACEFKSVKWASNQICLAALGKFKVTIHPK